MKRIIVQDRKKMKGGTVRVPAGTKLPFSPIYNLVMQGFKARCTDWAPGTYIQAVALLDITENEHDKDGKLILDKTKPLTHIFRYKDGEKSRWQPGHNENHDDLNATWELVN